MTTERKADPRDDRDDYVAWLCFKHRHDNQQPYLIVCDSDTPGAFKVYRRHALDAAEAEIARLRKAIEDSSHGDTCSWLLSRGKPLRDRCDCHKTEARFTTP